MTSISSVSGGAGAWATQATSRRERMFEKADADGSGGIDKSELQSVLDRIAQHGGATSSSASIDDTFSSMDTDGDGSLSADEMDTGMKRLMPPPSSTLHFASQRMGGPPPGGAPSSDPSTDPLDTNGDGTVSAEERMAADIQSLVQLADTDGDQQISSDEATSFKKQLEAMFSAAMSAVDGASTSTNSVSLVA